MKKRKSALQKASKVTGIVCFLLSVVCAIALYIKLPELGVEHPISASLIASIFFFVFIGFVFTVIANTDIPSFKFTPAILDTDADTDRSKDV